MSTRGLIAFPCFVVALAFASTRAHQAAPKDGVVVKAAVTAVADTPHVLIPETGKIYPIPCPGVPAGLYLLIDPTWHRMRFVSDTAWHYVDPVVANLLESWDREHVVLADSITKLEIQLLKQQRSCASMRIASE